MHKPGAVSIGVAAVRTAVLFVLVVWRNPTAARAQEFCAVTLNVTNPGGTPITSTWIEVIDASGKTVRREMTAGSSATVCDFGFGSNSLRVGANECLPVTVSNLRVVIGFPVHLDVILNSCGYREPNRGACMVYFRTQSESGDPIGDVDFYPRITEAAPRTDSYGRYQSLFRGARDVTFTKKGFRPTSVHLECRSDEEVDRAVVMSKEALGR